MAAAYKAGTVLGNYRLVAPLGKGGMGEVWHAQHRRLARAAAIKLILPRAGAESHHEAQRRFEREAHAIASLESAHTVRLYDFGAAHDGTLFFAMELLDGVNLEQLTRRFGPVGAPRAVHILGQACDSLAEAHQLGLIHRDLKPANVMLCRQGLAHDFVKVLDFGLVRIGHDAPGGARLTAVDAAQGTPAFLPPEVVHGTAAFDERSDVYALGCIAFWLLTGTLVFARDTAMDLVMAHIHDAPVPPSARSELEVPQELDALVLACLQKSPDDRPQDVEAFAGRLLDLDLARRWSPRQARQWWQRHLPEQARRALPRLPAPGAAFATDAAPRPTAPRGTDLRVHGDAFIGRGEDLDELEKRFSAGARLVTLLGPAGVGKTRILAEFAAGRAMEAPGGAWCCDLSEARTLADLVTSVSGALQLSLEVGASPAGGVHTIGHALAALGHVYVLIDNFEQLAPLAPASVAQWLEVAPEARFLIGSRAVLGLRGEVRQELLPLPEADAAALFLDRARQVRPSYEPGEEDRAAIAGIVATLDGLPLAIELAASRVSVLGAHQIRARLSQRFRLLARAGAVPTRQATLRGAIDVSWDLLSAPERSALAQCSVFRGGFTMEAADEILALDEFDGAPWALDVVQGLVDKSLVFHRAGGREPRLGMYASIQVYAHEKLDAKGATEVTSLRHARWYASRADRWHAASQTPRDLEVLPKVLAELDNLAAAHARLLPEQPELAVAPVLALELVLNSHGPAAWFLELADSCAGALDHDAFPERAAQLYLARGTALRLASRPRDSLADSERALALARRIGRGDLEARALLNLSLALDPSTPPEARTHVGAALEIAAALGREDLIARARMQHALEVLELGDIEGGSRLLEAASLEMRRSASGMDALWAERTVLGLALFRGNPSRALRGVERLLSAYRTMGARTNLGQTLCLAATAHAELDLVEEAQGCLREAAEVLAPIQAESAFLLPALAHGFLDLARARATDDRDERVRHLDACRGRLNAARAPGPDGGAAVVTRSRSLAMFHRMLGRNLERDVRR